MIKLWVLMIPWGSFHLGFLLNKEGERERERERSQSNLTGKSILSDRKINTSKVSVVDPESNWIRIQDLCGSVFGIRIPIQKVNIG